MAYEETLKSVSFDADSSLALYTGVPGMVGSASPNSGHQYKFVKITGRHQVGLAGAGEDAVGVVQNKPQVDGQAATVAIFGISTVRAGAAVTAGDEIEVDASGRGITATAGTVVGIAVESASGADALFSVLLRTA